MARIFGRVGTAVSRHMTAVPCRQTPNHRKDGGSCTCTSIRYRGGEATNLALAHLLARLGRTRELLRSVTHVSTVRSRCRFRSARDTVTRVSRGGPCRQRRGIRAVDQGHRRPRRRVHRAVVGRASRTSREGARGRARRSLHRVRTTVGRHLACPWGWKPSSERCPVNIAQEPTASTPEVRPNSSEPPNASSAKRGCSLHSSWWVMKQNSGRC